MSELKRASNILRTPFLKSGAGSDEDMVHPVMKPTARTQLNQLFPHESIKENVSLQNQDGSVANGVKIDASVTNFTRLEARMEAMEATEARHSGEMTNMKAEMEATEARHSGEMTNMEARMKAEMRARTDAIQANVARLGETVLGRFDLLSTQISGNFQHPPAPQNDQFSNKIALQGAVQEDLHAVSENVRQDFRAFGMDAGNIQ
jgi:hypothetical protein